MKSFFKELFEYHHHFNQQLTDNFINYPNNTSEKAMKLFNHLLNAHHIWNARIACQPSTRGVWELMDTNDLKAFDKINYEQTIDLLDRNALSKMIQYTTSNGQTFTNSVRDILFHIINHSTYHRGQIATAMKQEGIAPIVSDYIFYKR